MIIIHTTELVDEGVIFDVYCKFKVWFMSFLRKMGLIFTNTAVFDLALLVHSDCNFWASVTRKILPLWRYDMETRSALPALSDWNPLVAGSSLRTGRLMQSVSLIFVVVSPNKQLNELSICTWFETPTHTWCPYCAISGLGVSVSVIVIESDWLARNKIWLTVLYVHH